MLKREKMIAEQLVGRGINDENILQAFAKVPRHLFVPPPDRVFAYNDSPLPIGYEQTISQPFIVAYMTQVAKLDKYDKVLEVGTGSGYQTAILAEMVNAVYSIEILEPLAKDAEKLLKILGYKNIFIKVGNGYEGWPVKGPFDAIIVTAAPDEVPMKLAEQLRIGGKMVVPVGTKDQMLLLVTKTPDGFINKKLLPVRFVPMVEEKEEEQKSEPEPKSKDEQENDG